MWEVLETWSLFPTYNFVSCELKRGSHERLREGIQKQNKICFELKIYPKWRKIKRKIQYLKEWDKYIRRQMPSLLALIEIKETRDKSKVGSKHWMAKVES